MKKVSIPLNHPFWYPDRVTIYNDHFVRVSDVCLMACGCQHKSFAAWLSHNNYTKKLPAGSQRYNYVSLDNVGRTIVDYFKADNSRWNKQNMKEAIEEIKQSVQKAKKARKRPVVEKEEDEEEEEEEEEEEKEEKQKQHEVISLLSPECSSISFDSLDLDLEREASPPKKRFAEEEKEEEEGADSPASAAAYAAAEAGAQEAQSNLPPSPAAPAAGEGEPPSWWLSFRMRCEALLGPYADDSAFGPVEHDMPEQAKLFLEKLRK